jgi:signal transduction histidine kinase
VDIPPHASAKGRRRTLLYGLVPAFICAAAALYPPALLTRVDLAAYDTLLRFAATRVPDGRIVIVDVDERSLATVGQWPWRRDVVGRLIDRLRSMDARTIALDIIFSEPDRESGTQDASRPANPDAALAQTLRGGRVVVGYGFTFGDAANASRECVLHPLAVTIVQPAEEGGDDPFFHASEAICSLPVLAEAAGASGFLNAAPDSDGVLRRVPLILGFGGQAYPGLALAAVMASATVSTPELRVANANTTSLALGGSIVSLDGRTNLLLRYRGGKRTFPYVSAADVLAGRVLADGFRDKIVFVGATALGTQLVATPYDPLFAGVELQATVADNLLSQDFIRRLEHALIVEALVVLSLGIGVALAIRRFGVGWGALAAVTWLAMLWGATGWLLASKGVFLSPLLPTCAIVTSLAAVAFTVLAEEMRAALAGMQRARRESEAAANVKNEFLMTLSHELRTPLTSIYGYAQALARGRLKDDQKSTALENIERNARAQTQLIGDLLDASQAVSGQLRLDVKEINLADVVRPVADALRPAMAAKRITLDTAIDGELRPTVGDPDRLQQVAWKLLSNAIKFTPEGGRVSVRLEEEKSCLELTVSDSGVGISPDFLPYVFEPFQQQDGSSKRRHGGLGLGLALVRHLVELHGGSVEVESQGEGCGATFRVRLPAIAALTRAPATKIQLS